ncbi:beta-propeller fold lactonase family protein [Paenibacillus profundus]|uniref:Beta-propeller fold lactonase family protein n=1 Tax=Paenibacillus profundus TaxID=1173085 RepID=A0ABS8YMQ9_9BACL|nr:beta-propeller fold lactonase family protein [Paenibacillus profundus]MCE5171592.1 beta-propeller fold lactonase family protein [Paenibacillus profundus]
MNTLPNNYVIAIERAIRRVSFVDTDTLTVAQQISIDGDIMDVAITSDFNKAVISAFLTQQLFKIDLRTEPPSVVNTFHSPTALEDVALSADNRFAVSVDGTSVGQLNMVSYSLEHGDGSWIPADAQAVAVSPDLSGRILTARFDQGRVRLYLIDNAGMLTDTGSEVMAGDTPFNLSYTPDGRFCFVANFFANEIVVLYTGNPNYFGETSRTPVIGNPQTIVVSKNGQRVYVLTTQEVASFEFDPVAQRLSLTGRFNHNLNIVNYFGVERMTLDATETKLIISGQNQLAAFDLNGTLLGIVPGVQSDGGVAAGQASHRLPTDTLLVTSLDGKLQFFDETLSPVIGEVNLDVQGIDTNNVVISRDCSRALVASSSGGFKLLDIDLTTNPPSLKHTVFTPVPVFSLDITPDSRYAVGAFSQLISYSFSDQTVKSIPADAQAVVVSPNGNGLILAASYSTGRIRRYHIDAEGNLTDTGSEVEVGDSPANLAYSPDGNYAFVANWGAQEVVVLDTSSPDYFGETSRVGLSGNPDTILVSRDGSKVYVLNSLEVQIFNFDPVAERLTLSSSFNHNLRPVPIVGVTMMALNSDESLLYILTFVPRYSRRLVAFTTTGEQLYGPTGDFAPGVAICKPV